MRRVGEKRSGLYVAGLVLLVLWAGWWVTSLWQNKLLKAKRTWIPAYESLGVDFLSNYYSARHWLAGGDPYVDLDCDPLHRVFCYPPLMLPCFAWCQLCTPRTAVIVWWLALVVFAVVGVVAARRVRQRLDLQAVPLPFLLAAFLGSTPVLFALERGNCDLLILALLMPAAWALQVRSLSRDLLAGLCLALAAVLKIYPAFVLFSLLPLRRVRAFTFGIGVSVLLCFVGFSHWPEFRANLDELIAHDSPATQGNIAATVHTLSGAWQPFWKHTALPWLGSVPGTIAAFALGLPLVTLVSYRLFRLKSGSDVCLPYLLWLAGAATFLPEVSNDYNLVFLPLAALMTWDRRDSLWVQICLAFLLLWWQPFALPIGAKLLLAFKFGGLVAVGATIVNRAGEQAQALTRERSACIGVRNLAA